MSEAEPGLTGVSEGRERKRISVVFADLVGSTELSERLDPEAFRLVLDRYHQAVADAVGRHGGSVDKFMGDGVLAVFGVPAAHEDDALRAARAALEAREAVRAAGEQAAGVLGVGHDVRIGVNTGEVLAGPTELLGDAVNTAKRLQEAAQPGESPP